MPAAAPDSGLEIVPCPLCHSVEQSLWASENGYQCVRCLDCGLLYVSPRPSAQLIDRAVQLGSHQTGAGVLDVRARRVGRKVAEHRKLLRCMLGGVLERVEPVSWLDIGAGYGEFLEAVATVAPAGSEIEGLEPMEFKAKEARARGLVVRGGYLSAVDRTYDFVSVMDVFSHIPDFRSFLRETAAVLRPNGEVLIKTGNAADIGPRSRFPGPLTLPDHLVFAGEHQLIRFLREGGFEPVTFRRERMDGVWYSMKNTVKWVLGRPVHLSLPYTSPYRVLFVRARLTGR